MGHSFCPLTKDGKWELEMSEPEPESDDDEVVGQPPDPDDEAVGQPPDPNDEEAVGEPLGSDDDSEAVGTQPLQSDEDGAVAVDSQLKWPRIDIKAIPVGYVDVEVEFDCHGKMFKTVMVSGHMAIARS